MQSRKIELIHAIIKKFMPKFFAESQIVYKKTVACCHATNSKKFLRQFGADQRTKIKMPDVVIHDHKRNWLILIEAVTSAGPVDGKRRMELKKLFNKSSAGLVFVTAFETRRAMQAFVSQISWESEVWIAEAADHLIHFNGERFLGPYPDALPTN